MLRHCFEWLQHCSDITTPCCAINRRRESSRATLPLKTLMSAVQQHTVYCFCPFFFIFVKVVKGQDDPCRGVVCPRGRMCVPHTNDEGKSYSTCECPTSCTPEVNEPVCSYYNTSFISRCEMHKFACAHDLTMKVKNEGSCPSDTVGN